MACKRISSTHIFVLVLSALALSSSSINAKPGNRSRPHTEEEVGPPARGNSFLAEHFFKDWSPQGIVNASSIRNSLDKAEEPPALTASEKNFVRSFREGHTNSVYLKFSLLRLKSSNGLPSYDALSPATRASLAAIREAYAAKEPTVYEALSQEVPYVYIKRMADQKYRLLEDQIISDRLNGMLATSISTSDVKLLFFKNGSFGEQAYNNNVPHDRKVTSRLANRLQSGNFDVPDLSMFSEFKGKTVVVMGHIASVDAKPAFEIHSKDGTVRYLFISQIEAAARQIGFNWIPLGCKTAESSTVGTTNLINDLDGIDSFLRATKKDEVTTFGHLIANLAGPRIEIAYDLSRIGAYNVVPFEVQARGAKITSDANEATYALALNPNDEAQQSFASLVDSDEALFPPNLECGFGSNMAYRFGTFLASVTNVCFSFWALTLISIIYFPQAYALLNTNKSGGNIENTAFSYLIALIGLPAFEYYLIQTGLREEFDSIGPPFIALICGVFLINSFASKRCDQAYSLVKLLYYATVCGLVLGFLPLILEITWYAGLFTCGVSFPRPV